MTPWSTKRLITTGALALVGWFIVAASCTMVGSTGTIGWPSGEGVLKFRIEVVLISSMIGCALAVSGVVYQAILRNPLADPFLLGVSSGAALASYLWKIGALAGVAGAIGQQSAAFVGAAVSVSIAFILSTRRGRIEPVTLILVGVIVNAVNGSIFLLVDTLYRNLAGTGSPLAFLVGAINTNLTGAQIASSGMVIAIGTAAMLAISGKLHITTLGDVEAQSLGVNIQRIRWVGLIVASIVTASAVAISGPIGFVGLVCPHVARLMVGRDVRIVLPVSMAIGGALLAMADAISRILAATGGVGAYLPVGVLTGLLGGPFFLMLMYRRERLATP